jgi:CheY-like chemotaxis protein
VVWIAGDSTLVDIPIIAISASSFAPDKAIPVSQDAFLLKPIDVTLVQGRHHLGHFRANDGM